MSFQGWALAMQGQGEEGRAQVRRESPPGRPLGQRCGSRTRAPCWQKSCPSGPHSRRPPGAGRGPHLVEQHEERYWEAEVCRVRGVLLLRQPETSAGGGRRLLPAGPGRRPSPAGKVPGATRCHEPESLWQQQGSATKPASYWRRSIAGSPRALTRQYSGGQGATRRAGVIPERSSLLP